MLPCFPIAPAPEHSKPHDPVGEGVENRRAVAAGPWQAEKALDTTVARRHAVSRGARGPSHPSRHEATSSVVGAGAPGWDAPTRHSPARESMRDVAYQKNVSPANGPFALRSRSEPSVSNS